MKSNIIKNSIKMNKYMDNKSDQKSTLNYLDHFTCQKKIMNLILVRLYNYKGNYKRRMTKWIYNKNIISFYNKKLMKQIINCDQEINYFYIYYLFV